MSKIIKINECPAWCWKRGIEPGSFQGHLPRYLMYRIEGNHIRSLLACLDQHRYLLNYNDNRDNCFKDCCLFPTIENFIKGKCINYR